MNPQRIDAGVSHAMNVDATGLPRGAFTLAANASQK